MQYKFRKLLFLVILISGLGGCQMPDMPPMPDIADVKQMFSFGRRAEPPPSAAANPVIEEAVVDFSSPPIQCEINEGNALFGENWYSYTPISFNIRKNQQLDILIARQWGDEQSPIMARFDANGQKLVFCPMNPEATDNKIICESLYALEEDFNTGITRTLDIPDALRGGRIKCKKIGNF